MDRFIEENKLDHEENPNYPSTAMMEMNEERIITKEQVLAARRRLRKIDQMQNQSNLFVADAFQRMKMDVYGGFLGSAPFGDYCKFVGQPIINPRTQKVSYDSLYNLSAEFLMSDFCTLQMLGLVTTKNNLMIAMLFPRIN